MSRAAILLCGPARAALSGVSTHVNLLMGSRLAEDFDVVFFQVGSEGRRENAFTRWARLAFSPLALIWAITWRQVAIVHLNTSLNLRAYWRDVAYLLVAKLLGMRVVYQVHGGELPEEFFAESPARTAFLRWTLGLPDLVLVLASAELAAYRAFVPHQEVVALPNGVDCAPYARVPTVRSRRNQPLNLVYVGRLAREKGLYEALQGVRIAQHLGVDARIVLAGEGAEAAGLREHAESLGLGSSARFVGPVFGEDKVRTLAGADVAILPSWSEGLPYALLEAMAAGIPVLATPVGAIPDVMTDGLHGLLVPRRDAAAIGTAIAKLAFDRERLAWMSRACRKRVLAAYSIERLAAELAIHYHALAGGLPQAAVRAGGTRVEPRVATRAGRAPLDIAPGGE